MKSCRASTEFSSTLNPLIRIRMFRDDTRRVHAICPLDSDAARFPMIANFVYRVYTCFYPIESTNPRDDFFFPFFPFFPFLSLLFSCRFFAPLPVCFSSNAIFERNVHSGTHERSSTIVNAIRASLFLRSTGNILYVCLLCFAYIFLASSFIEDLP